ncbi:hypothetical protein TWF225_006617 [Orbilia oligospora]|nr:hypothetical protein TWF225_006617 [Orbilia oligospora]KAF3254308.1 hypothetical protein TWF217_007266 [Orbilia oligospora]KAF3267775.1 hypothetical protein TWF128_009269 [Orbilia oligospora]KAF3298266.1 hypothetical protein TWF132_000098 [Orbilia oligospora]
MAIRGTAPENTRYHRMVRRQTFGERIASFLNPMDNWLAISLLFEEFDWDGFGESVALPVSIALNVALIVFRASSDTSGGWRRSSPLEDVLRDPSLPYTPRSTSWWGYLFNILAYGLFMFSVFNTVYTLNRTRPYRNFEHSVHGQAPTPSARRVRVYSPTNQYTPVRMFKSVFPDLGYNQNPPIRDSVTEDEIWEIPKWDYTNFNLSLSAYFSPLHCVVIFCLLPYTPPKTGGLFGEAPSTTYSASWMAVIWHITLINVFISVYLHLFFTAFKTQSADDKYIHGQVLHEYSRKFVQPRVNPQMRDAGTSTENGGYVVSTPAEHKHGFKTRPHPAYEGYGPQETETEKKAREERERAERRQTGGLFSQFMTSTPGKATTTNASTTTGTSTARRASGMGNVFAQEKRIPAWTPQRLNAAGVPVTESRQSFGLPGAGAPRAVNAGTSTNGRKSFAGGDLMTPARKVSGANPGLATGPRSVSKPGRNGNVWGGGVDYGVPSPMKRVSRRGL